jgi:hypothetical protein
MNISENESEVMAMRDKHMIRAKIVANGIML